MVRFEWGYETLAEYADGSKLPIRIQRTWRGRLGSWVRRKVLRQPDRPIIITIYKTGVDPGAPMTTLKEEKGTR